VSHSVAVNVDFRGYLQFLCVRHEKLSDGHSYFTVEKTDLHSATNGHRGELCSKIRTVDAGM